MTTERPNVTELAAKKAEKSKRKRVRKWATKALAGASLTTVGLSMAACAEEAPKPIETSYEVRGVMLQAGLAESRHNVLELCNTGEGAQEMEKDWKDFGFEDESGMPLIDAITYTADYGYEDPQAIVNYGSYSYPTIEALAENCQEVMWLATRGIDVSLFPETASISLEEFRDPNTNYTMDAMQSVFNSLPVAES